MGLSIKCTRSVALLAFVVILMLEGSTADSPQEALHKEVHITEFSRFELGEMLIYKNIYTCINIPSNQSISINQIIDQISGFRSMIISV